MPLGPTSQPSHIKPTYAVQPHPSCQPVLSTHPVNPYYQHTPLQVHHPPESASTQPKRTVSTVSTQGSRTNSHLLSTPNKVIGNDVVSLIN